jgi:inhibitor of KinA sporulation pathway (predicted exonuclease)
MMEIIEFPSVLYKITESSDGTTCSEYIAEFHEYVRPTMCPVLSEFCTFLTGIEQTTVDQARTIGEVYHDHIKWLHDHVPFGVPCIIATDGDWDLQTQLPRELRNKMLKRNKLYSTYINVKHEFEAIYATKARGMTNQLDFLGLTLDGRHHSGIDDTKNIAKIMLRIIEDGRTFQDFIIHTVDHDTDRSAKEHRSSQNITATNKDNKPWRNTKALWKTQK